MFEEYHWFTSSAANWSAHSDLAKCLDAQRKSDRSTFRKGYTPPVAIYKVPGPSTRTYNIRHLAPAVEGAEFVGYVNGYPKADCYA